MSREHLVREVSEYRAPSKWTTQHDRLAGSFWAVSLAQSCIQVLTSEMNETVPKASNN